MEKQNNDGLPEEVALVKEVKSCKACAWFWGGIPPYGPYPSIDWDDPFPPAFVDELPQDAKEPIKWTTAEATGSKLVEPAILRGCRKAPIMTIGINPNLTAYFASSQGATWAYPWFSNVATYAYYYRHATVFQESLDLDRIKDNIALGTELKGKGTGWLLKVERGSDHRWMILTVLYEGKDEPENHEIAWTPEARAVVLIETIKSWYLNADGTGFKDEYVGKVEPNIKDGSVIAGTLKPFEGVNVNVNENGTGYYQRLLPALEEFKKQSGGALVNADIGMGEDVCMHDMVGCASPGWSDKYDIPRDAIEAKCVQEKQYVLREILESRPPIIILVSTSSMNMFARNFEAAGGKFDMKYENRDVYDLLKETCSRRHYITYDKDGVDFKARVIITPHFSYYQNFQNQSRFSEAGWLAFKEQFPNDAEILENNDRVQPLTWNGIIPVEITGPDDPIEKELGYAAWGILLAHYYDPYALLTEAFLDEHNNGTLILDEKSGHLKRGEGNCSFCINSEWKFPEGCPYGKC